MDKSLTDRESIETIICFLEDIQADFNTVLTNYTTCIEYGKGRGRFLKSFRGKKCFAAFTKIKKEVSAFAPPDIEEENLDYFFHDIRNSFKCPKAIQIDIRKAYATVLKNKGYISEGTYKYISSLSKNDRLACVGMLASIKHSFTYRKGKVEKYDLIESPLKNFFFFCVKEVYDIMNSCRIAAGSYYIMTWVDAIYIGYNEKLCRDIQTMLYYNGFDSEAKIIYDFNCIISDNKISLSLDDGFEKKKFFIPHTQNVFARHIASFVTRNEKNKI